MSLPEHTTETQRRNMRTLVHAKELSEASFGVDRDFYQTVAEALSVVLPTLGQVDGFEVHTVLSTQNGTPYLLVNRGETTLVSLCVQRQLSHDGHQETLERLFDDISQRCASSLSPAVPFTQALIQELISCEYTVSKILDTQDINVEISKGDQTLSLYMNMRQLLSKETL